MREGRLRPTEVIEAALGDSETVIPEDDATNALVLSPADARGERRVCGGLVSALAPVKVLGVALRRDDAYYADLCREFMTEAPVDIGVVHVGGDGTGSAIPDENVTAVSEAGDLTGTGIKITNYLKEFAGGEPTVVCFDSLTPLLQYAGVDRCYRFLDLTTRRIEQVCAVSHAHLNPDAHDDQTVESITQVFDTIIEPAGEGDAEVVPGWTVRPA
jgi:hypothetical protein